MDAVEILDQLTHAEGLPKAALQVASAQRVQSAIAGCRPKVAPFALGCVRTGT